jgi:hypothetical protein
MEYPRQNPAGTGTVFFVRKIPRRILPKAGTHRRGRMAAGLRQQQAELGLLRGVRQLMLVKPRQARQDRNQGTKCLTTMLASGHWVEQGRVHCACPTLWGLW